MYHPWRAANRTVLDVSLTRAAARIDRNLDLFATVWAYNHRFHIRNAIAQREIFVQRAILVFFHGFNLDGNRGSGRLIPECAGTVYGGFQFDRHYSAPSEPLHPIHRVHLTSIFANKSLAGSIQTILFAAFCSVGAIAVRSAPAIAQAATQSSAVTEAMSQRDSGDFKGAVSILQAHLARYPDDGDALRLLAETLYWQRDFAGAIEVSERSLRLHPEDTSLRLQYAQMLIETGHGARAREVLEPVDSRATHGRSDAILGTLAYWEGDLASADKLVGSAIAAGDTALAIRRIRADIGILTAPWLSVTPSYQHDDQPINRAGVAAQAGWFPVKSTSVSIHGEGLHFSLGDTATRSASTAEVVLSHYAAAARTDFELGAGAVTRSFGSQSDVIGRVGIAARLPGHVRIGARGYRAPYFATEASLSQSLMTNTGIAFAHLDDPRGWLGEAAYQLQRFPDSNNLTTAYAWLLAPIVHSSDVSIQAGYAGAFQTSSESRFTLANTHQPYPPTDSRFNLSGAYQPYYTPIDLQSHSAVAALELHPGPGVTLSASGSYAIRATETSPTFVVVTTTSPPTASVQRLSYTRTFNPYNARGSIQLGNASGLSLVIAGEAFRTGFYSANSASLSLVYRFTGRALRETGAY